MLIKINPSKRVVPMLVVVFCTLFYIAIAGLVIAGFVLVYNKDTFSIVLFGMALLIVLLLIVINQCFSWYSSAEIFKCNKFIAYNVKGVVSVLGRDTTKNHIYSVSRLHWSGRNLIVYGKVEVFEPMSRKKSKNKVKILDASEEVADMLLKMLS